MGYMGFGMQKWIYTQKPKKVFKREKTIYGEDLNRLPHIKSLKDNAVISESEREALLKEVEESNKRDRLRKVFLLAISVIVAVCICYILILIVKNFIQSVWI